MQRIQRVVRKVERPGVASFDDRLWPINVALCVLASFLLGVVTSYVDFDDDRWYANAYTWILIVSVITAGLLLTFRFLDPRRVRRVLQLAVVLALLWHCIMVVVLFETSIFGRIADADRPAKDLMKLPRQTTPRDRVFQLHVQEQPQQDFQRPVPTPTFTQQAMEVNRQTQAQSSSNMAQPHDVQMEQETQQPNAIQRTQTQMTAPHKSDRTGQLSRNRSQNRPRTAVAQTSQGQRTPQQAPQMSARRNLVQRQRTEREPNTRPSPQPDADMRSVGERASQPNQLADNPRPRPLPRRRRSTRQPANSTIASPATPSVAQRTEPQALTPQRVQQIRQDRSASQISRSTNEANPDPLKSTAAVQRRQSPAERQQDFARSPQPTPQSRSRSRRTPTTQERPAELIVENNSTPSPRIGTATNPNPRGQLAPRASQVTRRQETSPLTPTSDPAANVSTTTNTRATRARADNSTNANAVSSVQRTRPSQRQLISNNNRVVDVEPTPSRSPHAQQARAMAVNRAAPQSSQVTANSTPQATTTQTTAPTATRSVASSTRTASATNNATASSNVPMPRASRRSQVASTIRATAPAEAEVQSSQSRQLQAAPTAFSRSTQGMAGAGSSRNLDRGLSAAQSPARVASGSARRAQATQATPASEAFSPSQTAQLSRSRSGGQRPMTTRQAQAQNNLAAGSHRVDPRNASASAALETRSANAAPATTTGAAGDVEIDLGPTRRVSGTGAGRASGGGSQVLNLSHNQTRTRRRASGISANTIRSAVTGPVTQSPGTANPRNAAQPQARATTVAQSNAGQQTAAQRNPAANRATGGTTQQTAQASQVNRAQTANGASSADIFNPGQPRASRRRSRNVQPGTSQVAQPAAQAGGASRPGSLAARNSTVGRRRIADGSGSRSADLATPGEAPGTTRPGAIQRAAASQGAVGQESAGGGTSSPRRRIASAALRTPTRAAQVVTPGGPQSTGQTGPRVGSAGPRSTNLAGGARGARGQGPVGNRATGPGEAANSDVARAGASGTRATGQGSPSADAGSSSASIRRSRRAIGPRVAASEVESPSDSIGTPTGRPNTRIPARGLEVGGVRRQSTSSRQTSLDAPMGVGGVGDTATVDPGVRSRRARPESQEISNSNTRFLRKRSAGALKINVTASVPKEAFQQRTARVRGRPAPGPGAGPQTEKAIELGLLFLSQNQEDDGRWTLGGFRNEVKMNSDTAATGLALLSFQGAGYHHKDFKYKKVVNDGIQFLLKNQKADGDLFISADDYSNRYVKFYSHSIAALALCEAYGMTLDDALREPAQKALDYLVKTQSPRGGWRYKAGSVSSDTSVTGWVYMAFKSGQLAGLQVPKKTYDGITRWLNDAQASRAKPYLFRYNPYAKDSQQFQRDHQTKPSPTMTSVGLLLRLYEGWRPNNKHLLAGADYLNTNAPSKLPRDTYYWYYATQVMYHVGGEPWKKWYGDLYPLLVKSQVKTGNMAGSWDPVRPVADRWAQAGRLYVTTMNLLSLEVHYRHLPLYK